MSLKNISKKNKLFLRQFFYLIDESYVMQPNITVTEKNNIHVSDSELKNIIDSSVSYQKFFPSKIFNFIKEKKCNLKKIHFKINNRTINIHLYSYEKNITNDDLKFIISWFNIVDKMAPKKCSVKIDFYLFLINERKKLPSIKNHILESQNVNSAFTYGCREHNKIVIYRYEEWKKVLIHETMHMFNFDFNHENFFNLKKTLQKTFQINSEYLAFETYCESIASIWYSSYEAYKLTKNLRFFINYLEAILFNETYHFAKQSNKILNHFDCHYKSINKCKNYNENTNVFCYYILKTICFIQLDEFLSLCIKHYKKDNILNLNFTKTCEEDFSSFFKKNAFHSNTLKIMESVKYDKDLYLKMMDLT